MSLIDHALQQNAIIFETEDDRYGTQKVTNAYNEKVRFRYITELDKNTYMEGLSSSQAMIWFGVDTKAKETSIVRVDGRDWRIEKLVKARRLKGDTIFFYKGFVSAFKLSVDWVS
ncbi:MAG: hypothetical protein WC973_03060 [Candidatus Dojkabacteria bacterium]